MGRAKIVPVEETTLLPFQKRWVEDTSRLKLAEKSRQIGWTWACACGLVKRKGEAKAQLDAWISSRDEIQARLFLEDCKHFALIWHIAAKDRDEEVVGADGQTAFVLQFSNGIQVHSMTSNADAQAGKRGDRVLDEFALHPDPRKLYAIAYPGITWGGSLEIFSTHRGTGNYFNQLVNEIRHGGNPKGFSFHSVNLQQALEEGLLYKLQAKLPPEDERQGMDEGEYFDFIRRGCADEETFLQEYMCQPGDDSAAFLSHELITGCEYGASAEFRLCSEASARQGGVRSAELTGELRIQNAKFKIEEAGDGENAESGVGTEEPPSPGFGAPSEDEGRKVTKNAAWELRSGELGAETALRDRSFFAGVDVGRDHDLTVIWVLEAVADLRLTRAVVCLDRVTFDAQERELYAWLENPAVKRCCIDCTGMGRQFAERAQQKFGKYRVEGLHFTGVVKEELAYPVRAAFEGGAYGFPRTRKSGRICGRSRRRRRRRGICGLRRIGGGTGMRTGFGRWHWHCTRRRAAAGRSRTGRWR